MACLRQLCSRDFLLLKNFKAVKKRQKEKKMRVLWLSRHTMTPEQFEDLVNIYGSDIEIVQYAKSVKDAAEVMQIGADCAVLAVVLPPAILADLTSLRFNPGKKPVIRSVADRVETDTVEINPATGKEEKQFKFVHRAWEQVLKVEVVTKTLSNSKES